MRRFCFHHDNPAHSGLSPAGAVLLPSGQSSSWPSFSTNLSGKDSESAAKSEAHHHLPEFNFCLAAKILLRTCLVFDCHQPSSSLSRIRFFRRPGTINSSHAGLVGVWLAGRALPGLDVGLKLQALLKKQRKFAA
jgi:hypothetical protein